MNLWIYTPDILLLQPIFLRLNQSLVTVASREQWRDVGHYFVDRCHKVGVGLMLFLGFSIERAVILSDELRDQFFGY